MNQHATIGHNRAPTPFDDISVKISDLYDEAKLWLDGDPITTQEQADALNVLKGKISEAAKEAETLRKGEVKPHDEAKTEIQCRYNPLIGNTKAVTGKTILALDCIKDSLRPYLLELDRIQREAAAEAQKEADAKAALAREAMSSRDTLEDREKAEAIQAQADQAAKDAKKADSQKAHAKGAGRATGLRSVWRAELIDEKAAAAWMWVDHRAELMAFVQGQADKAVRAGKRQINGFTITEKKEL